MTGTAAAFCADPALAARLVALLRENSLVHAALEPTFAVTMASAAAVLETAVTPRRARAVAPAQKRAAAARAAAWMATYRTSLPAGSAPPSARKIIQAAQQSEDGRAIPRRILLAACPPEWMRQSAPIV